MRDNELIVVQTCECPFVKYCIVIVVDLELTCVSQSLLWQGVCLKRVVLKQRSEMYLSTHQWEFHNLFESIVFCV